MSRIRSEDTRMQVGIDSVAAAFDENSRAERRRHTTGWMSNKARFRVVLTTGN